MLLQIVFRIGFTEVTAEKILESCAGAGSADISAEFSKRGNIQCKGPEIGV